MPQATTLEVEGRTIELTHLDRLLWPEAGFTKGDMVDYYATVAPALLPHLAHRPLTLGRFPEGVRGPGWAQTECRGRPPWLATAPIQLRSGRVRNHCMVNDLPSLLWVANQGAVELHPLLALVTRPLEPTAVIFDLDPGPGADLADACHVALRLRALLSDRGRNAFVKTSGALGLHVVSPLEAPASYRETKAFAREVARQLAEERPGDVIDSMRRSAREGKILVDWAQNDERRSTVAPYSLRAMPWPTVSTPVTWDEIEEAHRHGRSEHLVFDAFDVVHRIERLGDIFAPVADVGGGSGGRSAASLS